MLGSPPRKIIFIYQTLTINLDDDSFKIQKIRYNGKKQYIYIQFPIFI